VAVLPVLLQLPHGFVFVGIIVIIKYFNLMIIELSDQINDSIYESYKSKSKKMKTISI